MRSLTRILVFCLSMIWLAALVSANGEVHIKSGTTDSDSNYETIIGIENSTAFNLVGNEVWYTTSQTLSQVGYSFGYGNDLSSISYSWTTLNNPTELSLGDDEVSAFISLGFDTGFQGAWYNQVRVSSNGFVTFDDNSDSGCCSGQNLPNSNAPNNLIAGWWEDLRPASAGGVGTIKYEVLGSTPNRKMVIEFNDVAHYGDNTKKVSFQIVLKEN